MYRNRNSQSASEITELGLEEVDATGRLESPDRWGSLLGLEVPGDPPAGKDPSDWNSESPTTVDFLMVVCVLDRFADVSGVVGTSDDMYEWDSDNATNGLRTLPSAQLWITRAIG